MYVLGFLEELFGEKTRAHKDTNKLFMSQELLHRAKCWLKWLKDELFLPFFA